MYHYTECGLSKVWLLNGFKEVDTPYGRGVSIRDVEGLHRAIGKAIVSKARITGSEFRFLRKELGLSQRMLAECIGSSEQNVSLWERRGRIPKMGDRFIRTLYVEKLEGNVNVARLLQRLCEVDEANHNELRLRQSRTGEWREAA